MGAGTPAADVHIDAALVAALLRAQHPDLAGLPLRELEHGWDNVMYRLGEALLVRLPRRTLGAELILCEQRYLPRLAPALPIPVPVPVRLGVPGCGYPWSWSVLPWLPGQAADRVSLAASEAERLADFLLALHVRAPADAPRNPFRAVPLALRAEDIQLRIDALQRATNLVGPPVQRAWEAALAAPTVRDRRWVHGDLHARNVLVSSDGRITAIIDWGDLSGGDVATDVAAFWLLIDDADARESALRRYLASSQAGPGLRVRALGWAVAFATLLLHAGSVDDPRQAAMGEAILRRIADTEGSRARG